MKQYAFLFFTLLLSFGAGAEPYTPDSDNAVLETLPQALVEQQKNTAGLQTRLTAQPQNVSAAVRLARHYLQLGNQSGDPRYWGNAQAVLHPWWEQAAPPVDIRYLRAKLYEKQHDYRRAVADYQGLIASPQGSPQARLDLSNIYRVQGDYDKALQTCAPLAGAGGGQIYKVCKAPILALTGEAEQAYDSLRGMLTWARANAPALVLSNRILMAEIATALGDTKLARWDYFASSILAPDDLYLLRAYADYLLDQGEYASTLSMLEAHIQDNGILLRAAIAAERMGDARASEFKQALQNRFDEIRLRGDSPHARYEARFELELKHNPERALALARANWAQQKEPRDTQTLLAAALATKNAEAAKPAIEFLRRNRTENVALQRLIEQIEAL